jgi:ATP synthase protein I
VKINKENKKTGMESIKSTGPYLGLGFQLALTVVVLLFIGKWLDEKFDIYPVLTIIFAVIGSFAGIYNFIKVVLNLNRKNEKS